MAEKQKINMSIMDGDSFFSHETSINFSPTQFIFDFRCVTPRIDARSPTATIALKHNVVMMEPYHAKQFLNIMSKVVKKYESEFGKIEKPDSLKKFENKKMKMIEKTKEGKTIESPSYFG